MSYRLNKLSSAIEIYLSGDSKVTVKYTCKAAFTKDFNLPDGSLSIPAYGQEVSWSGVDLYELGGGNVKWCETYFNMQLLIRALQTS